MDEILRGELKLPDQGTAGGKWIKVGSDYKGVMFPVRMVGTNFQMQEWYIKVVWLGVDLSKYMEGDKLQVEKLTPEEAHKLMI